MDDPASFPFLILADTSAIIETPDPFWSALKIILVVALVEVDGVGQVLEVDHVG